MGREPVKADTSKPKAEGAKLKVPDAQLRLTPEQSVSLFLLRRMGAFNTDLTTLMRSEVDDLIERLAGKLGLTLGDFLRIKERLRDVHAADVEASLRAVWLPPEGAGRRKRD